MTKEIIKASDSKQAQTGVSLFKHIATFEDAEKLADYIAKADTYNKAFITTTGVGEDKKTEANKNDIIACLMLGAELGFSPLKSVVLGKRLNQQAIIKVERGKDLGLSSMSALQNIYIWEGGGREIVYTSIQTVNKVLDDAHIKREIIDDGSNPFYIYKEAINREEIVYDERYNVCINMGLSKEEIKSELEKGKLAVIRTSTKRGLVKLTRGEDSVAIPFTLIDAVEAGLYWGKDSGGNDVKGKDNWNKYPAAHLVKMSIMHGSRIIAADKLNGVYEADEISFIKHKEDKASFEEATVVEE